MFIAMPRVTRVRVSAVEGSTEEAAGTRRTSSKVKASRISMGHPPVVPRLLPLVTERGLTQTAPV
jgi:hypothetical protein